MTYYQPNNPNPYQPNQANTPGYTSAYPTPTPPGSWPPPQTQAQHQPPQQHYQPPSPNRRPATPFLVVLVLMVLAAGTFTTLYLMEESAHVSTSDQLQAKEQELSGAVEAQQAAESKVDEAEQGKRDADKKASDAQAQATEMTQCRDAARDLLTSLAGPDTPENDEKVRQALTKMADICT